MGKPLLPNDNTPDKKPTYWLVYSGMAFEMFAVIGVFTTMGYFADKKINTAPWLLIAFLLIGAALSFYSIFKQLNR
ncbi:MAG TPA: AtpZ/AtpI family protein [Chitinophagales bacterium]|jgi:F0F1-type ATP synthase assembly protein I|nr:AtpZ/AtpI family protein [Chitinophagales bacterium]